jgi:uncharacterized OB-fold protein
MEFVVEQVVSDAPESAPLWAALAEGRLCLQRCGSCSRLRFPPIASCPYCAVAGGEWEEVELRGQLYSWVITHVAFAEELEAEVPYTIGTVEIAEGPRIFARLTDVAPEALRAGLPLEGYVVEESGLPYLRFRPLRSA